MDTLITAFFMGFPLAGLLYVLVVYLRWKANADPDASFARDYWYTNDNPLHRTWWPFVAIVTYLLLIAIVGLTVEYPSQPG